MTVSRDSRSITVLSKGYGGCVLAARFCVVLVCLAILFGAGQGRAQDQQSGPERVRDGVQNGPPLRLTPRPFTPSSAPDEQVNPTSDQPVNAHPGSSTDPVVTVDHLESPDPESVGTLDENTGGLSVDMWAGTPREFIERLTPRLPNRLASSTLRRLARRLLLTIAIIPPELAERGSAAQQDAMPSLVATRVERLQTIGLIGAAAELIEAAPTRGDDPHLLRMKVENLLIGDDRGGACAEAFRQQDRVDDAPGDSHRDQRNESSADGGVISGLARDDAFLAAVSEFFGLLRNSPRR